MINKPEKDRILIEALPNGFARHQVIYNDHGTPVDYIFLEINSAFEKLTDLKKDKVVGKKVTEVLPGIEKDEFDWIGIYGKVATEGKRLRFEQYSEQLKRWYDVQVYSDEQGFFITIFDEITERREEMVTMKKLLKLSEKLIGTDLAVFDYQAVVDSMLKLSGAIFVAINTYEDDRTKVVTRAIAGIPLLIERVSEVLDFKIDGQTWKVIPERLRKIEGSKLVRFHSLYEASMGALSKNQAALLQKVSGVGDIFVIEMPYSGHDNLGDMIFFMPRGKEIQNQEAIELFARQLGAVLGRLRTENELKLANENMTTVLENTLFGVVIIDKNRTIRWANPVACRLADVKSPKEFIGCQCDDYLCSAKQDYCPVLDRGEVLDNSERILRRRDGIEIPILKTVNWVNLEGEKVLLETFIDISDLKKAQQQITDQKERLANIVEGANVGTWQWNVQTGETIFNERWANIIGYTLEELSPVSIETWFKHTHPDDLEASERMLEQHFNGERDSYAIECRMKHKDGHWVWVNDRGKVISWTEDGRPLWVYGTHLDITDRKQAEEALKESEQKHREILEAIEEGYYEVDLAGNFVFCNESFCKMTGNSYDDLMGESYKQFYNNPQEVFEVFNQVYKTGKSVTAIDWPAITKDGQKNHLEISISLRRDGKGEPIGFRGVVRDITERRQVDEKIRYLSYHDQLTGLYNRHFLEEEMKRLDTERQLPISVIMVDLNGLKLVNDTYGHHTGDEFLKRAADILRSVCREEDLLSRFGGDEFVLYLPRTSYKDAQKINDRIDRVCRREQVSDVPLSLSTGLAVKVSIDQKLDDLLREAEDNMYRHKLTESRSGKSGIVNSLLQTLAAKSFETEVHTRNMQEIAKSIGEKLGLPHSELHRLSLLITLHDIGKINVPEDLLTKKEPLSAAEWEIMKSHSETGYRIAKATDEFSHVAEDILAHHEHWDGSGYPQGLKGEAIPLLARITAIADTYEVMSRGRPYKEAMSRSEIMAEFKRCSGTHFDPKLVELFLEVLEAKEFQWNQF